jgi:Right handed beta helix region
VKAPVHSRLCGVDLSSLRIQPLILVTLAVGCTTVVTACRDRPINGSAEHGAVVDRRGKTYYVSPAGSDSNPGTSASAAWKTLGRVNRATLHAGDTVLFRGGATFANGWLRGNGGGRSGDPITYATYGAGNANIPAIDVKHHSFLVFDHFTIRGKGAANYWGVAGVAANDVTIENSTIVHVKAGIGVTSGDRWRILNSTIHETGDSGILTQTGDRGGAPGTEWQISHNVISDTGLYDFGYGEHGIYLKCRNSQVSDNTITGFRDSGISQRYGNDTVVKNRLSAGRAGSIGIAFFPYDPTGHTSRWRENEIRGVTTGLYVPLHDPGSPPPGGTTKESFVVESNSVGPLKGGGHDWINMRSLGRIKFGENRLV